MLSHLSIRNLVLVTACDLDFSSGFSVFTGETGAGKSVLLDALGLALGMRGDSQLIRQGQEQASVTACFDISNNPVALTILKDQGLPITPHLIFRRVLTRGSSRAYLNDQLVSLSLIKEFASCLVDIHGQFDRLLEATWYRQMLDAYAQTETLRLEVGQAYDAWQDLETAWTQALEAYTAFQREKPFFIQQLAELDKVAPQDGEETKLLKEREALAHVGKLINVLQDHERARQSSPVLDVLYNCHKALQRGASDDQPVLQHALAALEKAQSELTEAFALVDELIESLADQPQKLQRLDERLYKIRTLARKCTISPDALCDYWDDLKQKLRQCDQGADRIALLKQDAEKAKQAFYFVAQKLHLQRCEAAYRFESAVLQELPPLRLEHAQCRLVVSELPERDWNRYGIDHVQFMVAMNKGQMLSPLHKTASGGELARMMLAIKVVLAQHTLISTLIFDEIDAGVGGAVSAAIGARLADLSKRTQVFSITHAPQLAAYGDAHFKVEKEEFGTMMRTTVTPLTLADRSQELARMLAGDTVTPQIAEIAQQMLKI